VSFTDTTSPDAVNHTDAPVMDDVAPSPAKAGAVARTTAATEAVEARAMRRSDLKKAPKG
jgi:hypothetical protein